MAALREGHYERALLHFDEAKTLNPDDGQSHFFSGVALNRLNRPEAALTDLDRALFLAVSTGIPPHADLAFERGWALLRVGRFRQSVNALRQYDAAHPGRGQTAEFLGRAYLGLGDHAAAEAQFEEAMRRDPALSSTVRLALASSRQARGEGDEAQRQLRQIVRERRADPLSKLLVERTQTQAPSKPWSVGLGAGLGHNSNVIALGDGQPLPADISSKSDAFLRLSLSATRNWQPEAWRLTLTYAAQADTYADVSQANQFDQILAFKADRDINTLGGAGVQVKDRYTVVDGQGYRNELAAGPYGWLHLPGGHSLELAYTYAREYYIVAPVSAAQDRDGSSHALSPAITLALSKLDARLRLGVAYRKNSARGADYDHDSLGLNAQFDAWLPWRVLGRAFYSYDRVEFDNAVSFVSGNVIREDDLHYLSLYLERALQRGVSNPLRLYLQYDYTQRQSNVRFYDYDQHAVSLGLAWAF